MPTSTDRPRLLTLRSGGWTLVAALGVTLLVALVTLPPIIQRVRTRPPGDGRDPATYGFLLEPSLIPVDRIVAAQHHRDLTRPLRDPEVVAGAEVEAVNRAQRGKFLVPSDLVVGVVAGGAARAYPLRLLTTHEVVNDSVGGVPIVVTFNPLCRSVAVFDRRVGGRERAFGTSGLVLQSNHLLYDRHGDPEAAPGGESLWSQVQGRAVTGPAAAAELRLVRLAGPVMHWGDWLQRHPGTDVMRGDPLLKDLYKNTSYDRYYADDALLFPVEPAPEDLRAAKAPVLVVLGSGAPQVVRYETIAERVDDSGAWRTEIGGTELLFRYRRDPEAAWVESIDGEEPPVAITMMAFAWERLGRDGS